MKELILVQIGSKIRLINPVSGLWIMYRSMDHIQVYGSGIDKIEKREYDKNTQWGYLEDGKWKKRVVIFIKKEQSKQKLLTGFIYSKQSIENKKVISGK